MTTILIEAPKIDPMDVARDMAAKHRDPGLIAAYLRLEKTADPTLGMSDVERESYLLDVALERVRTYIARTEQATHHSRLDVVPSVPTRYTGHGLGHTYRADVPLGVR